VKASNDFFDPLFALFFQKIGLPNLPRKTDYHTLARLAPRDKMVPKINAKLDGIPGAAQKATYMED
jgi:hypothetical protein